MSSPGLSNASLSVRYLALKQSLFSSPSWTPLSCLRMASANKFSLSFPQSLLVQLVQRRIPAMILKLFGARSVATLEFFAQLKLTPHQSFGMFKNHSELIRFHAILFWIALLWVFTIFFNHRISKPEPIGSVSPKILDGDKSIVMQREYRKDISMLCPGQAYPTPVYRYV